MITIIMKCITFYTFSASPGSVSIGASCTGSNCSRNPSEVIAGATTAAVLLALILTAIVVVIGVAVGVSRRKKKLQRVEISM